MRLGIFGNFYPSKSRLGPHTTGLVMATSELEFVDHITVFANRDADLSKLISEERVVVQRCWRHDDPLSLVSTLWRMSRARSRIDCFLFNVYVTSFGRGRVMNALGLMLGPAVSILTRRNVLVYLHNAAQTQDVVSLGYHPSALSIWLSGILIRVVARTTTLVVPLMSQANILKEKLHVHASALYIPYLEGLPLLRQFSLEGERRGLPAVEGTKGRAPHILLFGSWGPQKDLGLVGALLRNLLATEPKGIVTISGTINPGFDGFIELLNGFVESLPESRVRIRLNPTDEVLCETLKATSVIILPYRASGGASGVLSVAALFGIPSIATDLPQLRETAANLQSTVEFFDPANIEKAVGVVRSVIRDVGEIDRDHRSTIESKLQYLRERLRELLRPFLQDE